MAVLPDDFLIRVVADACEMKGIKDAQRVIKETHPVMDACAKIAYSQITKYCRRPFHWGEREEYYESYVGPLLLRVMPVDKETPIAVYVNNVALTAEQYALVGVRLVLFNDTKYDPGDPRYLNTMVIYTAGIPLIEANNTLYTAAVMQTIANYHRRDTYGLSQTSGEKGIAKTASDSGELIESVRQLLDQLIYNGIGYTMDGE
jgi:hypothetical protein